MANDATLATSRRMYLSQAELAQYANITVNDTDEADDIISICEEIIDAYVGPQDKFWESEILGRMESVTSSTKFTLETSQKNYDVDFFKWMTVEILGGTGEGQRRTIASNTNAGLITIQTAFATTPDTTSQYKIYQLAKFPRKGDVTAYSTISPTTYYKTIPEAIRRAVAAEVKYFIEMGEDFFDTDKTEKLSERIGDYFYQLAENAAGIHKLIAPKAKMLLRGYKNRLGQII